MLTSGGIRLATAIEQRSGSHESTQDRDARRRAESYAVKFATPDTAVEVTVEPDDSGETFLVCVADRGLGVAEADLDAIFEPIYRRAVGSSVHAFGLGLAAARSAIAAQGDPVGARNRPGEGPEAEIPPAVGVPELRLRRSAFSRRAGRRSHSEARFCIAALDFTSSPRYLPPP